jgi:hypothetical protein
MTFYNFVDAWAVAAPMHVLDSVRRCYVWAARRGGPSVFGISLALAAAAMAQKADTKERPLWWWIREAIDLGASS